MYNIYTYGYGSKFDTPKIFHDTYLVFLCCQKKQVPSTTAEITEAPRLSARLGHSDALILRVRLDVVDGRLGRSGLVTTQHLLFHLVGTWDGWDWGYRDFTKKDGGTHRNYVYRYIHI